MFIEDIRGEFYNKLIGKQILLLANLDVDSLCTCKILQRLLRDDGVLYILKPIEGIGEVRTHYKKLENNIDAVVLINCGATVDIMEILDQPRDKPIYIIDSHKPVHVLNIYDESKQVRIFTTAQECDSIPSFDEIFRSEDDMDDILEDEESEEENRDDADAEDVPLPGTKRKRGRLDPEVIQKKKDLQDWHERRRQILFEYTTYTSYGIPSALHALELAWKLSRDQTEIIWWAAVSLNESFVLERLSRATYMLLLTQLQNHIARISHAQALPRDCLKVTYETELYLLMYRHWNLYDSIKMTPHCATKFKTWCFRGEQRYHEFLADAGLPLCQVKQKFNSMDLSLRKILQSTFASQRITTKYRFDDITIGTFVAQTGFQNKQNAIDTALCAMTILEAPDIDQSPSQKFMNALEFLSRGNALLTEKAIDNAKKFVTAAYHQVQAICDLNQVIVYEPFMLVQIQPGNNESMFSGPSSARFLSQFIMKAMVATRRDARFQQRPMLLMTPRADDMCLVVGIPPVTVDASQSIFGKAFESVATKMSDSVLMDNFDASIVQVKDSEKQKFIDTLLMLLF